MDRVGPSAFLTPPQGQRELQLLENRTLSGQERLKLLNEFCKTCSRYRVIPKSMYIPDCSQGSVEVAKGGFANVSRGTYKGHQVAIKVVRVYTTSDLDAIFSVSLLHAPLRLYG